MYDTITTEGGGLVVMGVVSSDLGCGGRIP